MRSRAPRFAAALAILLGTRAALADPVPSLDLRGFHAPNDPASGIYIQPADSPDTGEWNVGLWTSYALRPVALRSTRTSAITFDIVKHQISSDVVAGVGLFHRLYLGFDLPVLLYQTGDPPSAAVTRVMGSYALPGQAFGDLGLDAKVTLVRPTAGELGGFALALHDRLGLPTGDTTSFIGEGVVTNEARLFAEYRLPVIGFHGALGFKLRGHHEPLACGVIGEEKCTSRFGHEIPFGVGVALRPQAFGIDEKGRMTWFLEVNGHIPAAPLAPFKSTPASSLQLSAAARVALPADLSVLAGVQTAFLGVGDSPARVLLSLSWAPRNHDLDGDGIPDEVDLCKELKEDFDGFQDHDGCPDADNDGDGIPDTADKCPNAKEDLDGYQDADGCPDLDNDGDRILDVEDACPMEAGTPDPDPKKNGCPLRDKDGDGIADDKDACPEESGPSNADPRLNGCPITHDADGDGIPDVEDACPSVKGVRSANPKENGCPDPDPDKDTFIGDEDKCPNEPETFNGLKDDDGCADEAPKKARPLVIVKERRDAAPSLELSQALKFSAKNELEAASLPLLRAVASELVKHPDWKVSVGVRASPKGGEAEADARAKAVAVALRRFARRESAADLAPWSAVKAAPRAAEFGVGLALAAPRQAVAKPDAPAPKASPAPAPAPAPAPRTKRP